MGSKLITIDKKFSPSPGAYEIDQHCVGKDSASKWGFGTEVRKNIGGKSLSPGPGAYVHKSAAFEGIAKPRFFMGEKIKPLKETTVVPGSGTYNPSMASTKTQMPSFSMKHKLGSSIGGTTLAPGPGNYAIQDNNKKTAPNYGFGTSTRASGTKTKLNVPGPGAYKLRSSIGDVPDYAMPNRTADSKYVWKIKQNEALNFENFDKISKLFIF